MFTDQDFLDFAHRQGFTLKPGGLGNPVNRRDGCACPRRLLANEVTQYGEGMYIESTIEAIQQRFGLTKEDQQALEDGFEDFGTTYKTNKYYKLGKRLARLVSLRE